MSEQIIAIEIIFENLDYVHIPMEHLGVIRIEKINISIKRLACNAILKYSSAESIYIQIMNSFVCNSEEPNEYIDIYEDFDKRLFENDIAYLRIHYINDTYEDIYVPWDEYEDKDWKNRLQRVTRDEDGNFIVQIG